MGVLGERQILEDRSVKVDISINMRKQWNVSEIWCPFSSNSSGTDL